MLTEGTVAAAECSDDENDCIDITESDDKHPSKTWGCVYMLFYIDGCDFVKL